MPRLPAHLHLLPAPPLLPARLAPLLTDPLLPDQLPHLSAPDLSPSSSAPWPLTAPRRALSVLAQVLLTRQAAEGDSQGPAITGQYVAIWQRAVCSIEAAATASQAQEDVTVTSIHLLLLLFHSPQKTILLALSRALTATCQAAPASPPPHY